MRKSFIISPDDHISHKRLDTYLSQALPSISRSLIKKHFEQGLFTSSQELSLKRLPEVNCEIFFDEPELKLTQIIPQNIPLHILHEDDDLIIINKQAGLVVHPAPGNPDRTLVNAILYHCPNLSGIGNEKRPGIVHRLDKGTSGIMVVAKSQKCHEGLVNLFSSHDIDRVYEAVVLGSKIENKNRLESLIGRSSSNRLKMTTKVKHGKSAVTHLEVKHVFKYFSHLELKLETGRTHQIRVHLSELLNSPIVNDPLYGKKKEEIYRYSSGLKNLMKEYEYPLLHAKVLGFTHPISKEKLYFEQQAPTIFQKALTILHNQELGLI